MVPGKGALQAKSDLTLAYTDAAGRTPATSVATELGGQTLGPGTYVGATLGLIGTVTLTTLGTGTDFKGTILAATSIAANTGATVEGCLLARTGAVTLDETVINRPECDTLPPGPTTTEATTTTTTTTEDDGGVDVDVTSTTAAGEGGGDTSAPGPSSPEDAAPSDTAPSGSMGTN